MNRMLFLAIALSVLLAGCPVATGPVFFEAPPADNQKGTFYFFRGELSWILEPMIKIDDKPFVKLARMGYSFTYLPPGVHSLAVEVPGITGGIAVTMKTEFEIHSGQNLVIRLTGTDAHGVLTFIPWEKAREEIQETKFTRPYPGF